MYVFRILGVFSVVFLFCFSLLCPFICFACTGRPLWSISLRHWAKNSDGVSQLYLPFYVAKATEFFPLLLHSLVYCPRDSEHGNFHVITGEYLEFLLKYCRIESGLTLTRVNPHWDPSRHIQLFHPIVCCVEDNGESKTKKKAGEREMID